MSAADVSHTVSVTHHWPFASVKHCGIVVMEPWLWVLRRNRIVETEVGLILKTRKEHLLRHVSGSSWVYLSTLLSARGSRQLRLPLPYPLSYFPEAQLGLLQ